MIAHDAIRILNKYASKERAAISQRFFKTGKGQYGEGDVFIGVTVPDTRKVAGQFKALPFSEIQKLLKSKIHEQRMLAVLILVSRYKRDPLKTFEFYTKHLKHVNNWDLVDVSAPKIIGEYLFDKNKKPLYELADSRNLWKERVAVVACYAFIRLKDFKDILKLSEKFMTHEHDLMHKACGWMLREVGKKDEKTLKLFLDSHYEHMPRTMLRYAIEKFPQAVRQKYMKKA